jgi:hypothetical protein
MTTQNGVGRVRRVVTGVDDAGRSFIVSDSLAPNAFLSPDVPGFGSSVAWYSPAGPVSNEGAHDTAAAEVAVPMAPSLGEVIFRVADFPPDDAYGHAGEEGLFGTIDGGDEAREGATHSSEKHFWFHKTDSIDFAVVLEGEIWLLLDEGECLLRSGDVVVQRGTAHSWSNRTDATCRMAFVLLGALPVAAEQPSEDALAARS